VRWAYTARIEAHIDAAPKPVRQARWIALSTSARFEHISGVKSDGLAALADNLLKPLWGRPIRTPRSQYKRFLLVFREKFADAFPMPHCWLPVINDTNLWRELIFENIPIRFLFLSADLRICFTAGVRSHEMRGPPDFKTRRPNESQKATTRAS